ncbi:GNAT family N-acetyltransferase [Pullulanibacillus sp. KACC 23026]|uniref:bifunctional GNAT family N-acetyltransferase/carbon-nitrogen hydrolase family protein n=1 Tax=Pullulanibacillus sp. KACC 23026 TaxID=3028315 RepID=UPI0023B1467B|nr:bifunctional GNAT family N-acetyltransferase/carbon-nitrogen hydrolase family protein [Pullulanibacillus sp. KACC 23026]WEG12151.1 GNAT family N-acetyltransferase [Pullulanibacillus sp. KACC 23026]
MPKLDLHHFEKKMEIRNIQLSDIDAILELQEVCFPGMDPWKREQLESHLAIFPEGQFCVTYEGQIIGSCSSLIINFDEYDNEHTWEEITDNGYITNHDPEGGNLYGIEVMVHPDFRRMKIGRRLYEARKNLVRRLNLKSIVIGGRIPGYSNYKDKLTPYQYMEEVVERNIYDPVLTFQLMNGFTVKRINAAYLPDDKDSAAYATLMEWNNVDYKRTPGRIYQTSLPVRICAIQYEMRKISSFADFAHQVEFFTDVAADYRADFAVFPELLTTQLMSFIEDKSPSAAVRHLATFTEDYIELFNNLSVKYNVNIVGGSHFVEEEGHIYNVAYLFRRDGTIDKQYKIHITPNERKWWGISPGNQVRIFDTDRGKVAILICYDIQFPELARYAVDQGANIIFSPFCTDDRQGYLRVRYCSQARAVENQIFTVIAGTVGNLPSVENMDIQYGQSGIFSPSDYSFPRDGIVGEASPNIETVVVGDVDLEILRRGRNMGTVTQLKDRRSDLFTLRIDEKMK